MPRRVTITDVAARAGVAISSVSTALSSGTGVSNETRERIETAARELGFVPSLRGRSLASRRVYAIGLVVHRDPEVLELDPFFGSFIGGIESAIDARDYALVLQVGQTEGDALGRYRRLSDDQRVDGVLLSELTRDDPRTPLVRQLGLPAVGVNPGSGFPLPAVHEDHHAAIRDLAEHLAELGHRDVALIRGPRSAVHALAREAAWNGEVQRLGMRSTTVEGGFTFESGIAAACELLRLEPRPTAVFAANDLCAMGFISAARAAAVSVPVDMSIAGYDGIRIGEYLTPSLTSIATAPRELGAVAASMLLDLIGGQAPADVSIAPARLVVRESTGPVPA